MAIKGSCACKRIQYETQSSPLSVTACHCGACQRVSGAPFLAFVGFRATDLTWTQQPDIWQGSDIAERGFCKTCGSTLSMSYFVNEDRISVALGTLETTSAQSLPPMDAHIFLKDKAPYFVLADDGVNRYNGFPPYFQDKLDQWKLAQQKT